MKITALLVEPTLIGVAVLAAIALAVSPALDSWLLDANAGNLVIVSAIAYFIGIIFDRTADTILNRLLVLHRLTFALKKAQPAAVEPADERVADRFPEDRYHLAIAQGPAAWEYLSYHRSRIRLTRALLVLTPALGVAAAIRLANEAPWLRMSAILLVLFVYALAFALRSGEDLPRTDAPPKAISDEFEHDKKTLWRLAVSNDKELTSFLVGLAAVAGIVMFAGSLLPAPAEPGYGRAAGWSLLVAAGTLSAACVLFTSWWRITGTYFAFLWNHNRFVQSTAAGRPRRRN